MEVAKTCVRVGHACTRAHIYCTRTHICVHRSHKTKYRKSVLYFCIECEREYKFCIGLLSRGAWTKKQRLCLAHRQTSHLLPPSSLPKSVGTIRGSHMNMDRRFIPVPRMPPKRIAGRDAGRRRTPGSLFFSPGPSARPTGCHHWPKLLYNTSPTIGQKNHHLYVARVELFGVIPCLLGGCCWEGCVTREGEGREEGWARENTRERERERDPPPLKIKRSLPSFSPPPPSFLSLLV
jgi:hypothetical protein